LAQEYVQHTKDGDPIIYTFGPKFRGKYSNNKAGSSISGGWSDDGKKVWLELCKQIIASRKQPLCATVEQKVLAELRKRSNITASSHELQKKLEANAKKKDNLNADYEGVDFDDVFVGDDDCDFEDDAGLQEEDAGRQAGLKSTGLEEDDDDNDDDEDEEELVDPTNETPV